MTVDPQLRQRRVANGSRRKRDLVAAGIDPDAAEKRYHHTETLTWLAEHLPDEDPYAVSAVLMALRKSGRRDDSAAVMSELKARGWAKEQRS